MTWCVVAWRALEPSVRIVVRSTPSAESAKKHHAPSQPITTNLPSSRRRDDNAWGWRVGASRPITRAAGRGEFTDEPPRRGSSRDPQPRRGGTAVARDPLPRRGGRASTQPATTTTRRKKAPAEQPARDGWTTTHMATESATEPQIARAMSTDSAFSLSHDGIVSTNAKLKRIAPNRSYLTAAPVTPRHATSRHTAHHRS